MAALDGDYGGVLFQHRSALLFPAFGFHGVEARRIGTPEPLSDGLVEDLQRGGTPPAARLAFLASRLPAFAESGDHEN
jgi:hypothetical protein